MGIQYSRGYRIYYDTDPTASADRYGYESLLSMVIRLHSDSAPYFSDRKSYGSDNGTFITVLLGKFLREDIIIFKNGFT